MQLKLAHPYDTITEFITFYNSNYELQEIIKYCCLITSRQLWAKAKRCVSLNSITHWIIWISHGICLNAIGLTMTDWHSKHFVSFVCLFSTNTSKFFIKRRRSQLAVSHHSPASHQAIGVYTSRLFARCWWHCPVSVITLTICLNDQLTLCGTSVVINTGLSHCVLFFLRVDLINSDYRVCISPCTTFCTSIQRLWTHSITVMELHYKYIFNFHIYFTI